MNSKLKTTNLFKKIIDSKNIFSAIYCVESYIFEKDLLDDADTKKLYRLKDKFDFEFIEEIIKECKEIIEEIILNDEALFEVSVYLRPKKLKDEENIEYRPLHTSKLINQIAIVAMLNMIIFEDSENNQRNLSDLSKLLPHNFYGNIPSTEPEMLFYKWQDKYKKYTEDYMNELKACQENSSYLYEVSLDLVNFFPSVNPFIIYSEILKILSPKFSGLELECLKVVLYKLLFLKVVNIGECYNHYYQNLKEDVSIKLITSNGLYFSVGIPQGLPQAYYFGNICMIKVSEIFDSEFGGKSFYYVDDSVIYSNLDQHKDNTNVDIDEIFKSKLCNINTSLNALNNYDTKYLPKEKSSFEKKIDEFTGMINYNIKVHTEKKSSISVIGDEKYGDVFIRNIARQVSNCTNEMFSTFSETDDTSIRDKIKTILEGIEKEILKIKSEIQALNDSPKNKSDGYTYYLKKLNRFKRFYKLRLKMMNFRENNEIYEEDVKQFIDRFHLNLVIQSYRDKDFDTYYYELNNFFEIFDEDIFINELRFYFENIRDVSLKKLLVKIVNQFDSVLFKEMENVSNYSYFSKFVSNCDSLIFYKIPINEYINIDKTIYLKFSSFSKVTGEKKIQFIKEFIYTDRTSKDPWYPDSLTQKDYLALTLRPTSRMVRMTFNSIFSYIFNVKTSESFQIEQNNNRSLKYYELRILTYLKNPRFNSDKFIGFLTDLIEEIKTSNSLENVDYAIFDVLYLYQRFVRRPDYIDDIIKIHNYVSGIWKNGSKFLHFYTLHNQEHAMELIKISVSFVNCLDYLQISEFDYYILFLSCYLHDISMVLHPDIQSFVSDNFDTDLIYSEFKKEISDFRTNLEYAPKSKVKQLILEYFKKIDEYFENNSRSKHQKESAKFIRKSNELSFLENVVKEYTASVSEAHGYEAINVYGLKSKAKDSLVSIKYLMIILRFADLLDITKERVSINIMNQNLKHMSNESKFHWISHSIIDNCIQYTAYEFDPRGRDPGESYLKRKFFKETLFVKLKLNTQLLTKTEGHKCTYICSCRIDTVNNHIYLDVGSKPTDRCNAKDCTLICKWMSRKNLYLYEELYVLQQYLNRNNSTWFVTKTIIDLELVDKNILSSEHLDIVNKYLADK